MGTSLLLSCSSTPQESGVLFQDIIVGPYNSLLISENKSFWVYGKESNSFLFFSSSNPSHLSPFYYGMDNVNPIEKFSLGMNHGGFLTSTGEVFTWGYQSKGRLANGIDEKSGQVDFIKLDIEDNNFMDLSMGHYHTLLLSSANQLYFAGKLINDEEPIITPVLLELSYESPIISIASGPNRFAYINQAKQAYVMDGVLEVPELVNVSNVKQIVLGKEHSLVLNENGQVYSWGNHAYGALGAPGLTSPRQKPLRVQSLTNIAMIAAGSQTSYALSSDGRQLWSWGWNNHGQLGIGNKENQGIPTPINLEKILDQDETIVKIDSGFNFASFITSKGRLYTWGNAENFQLGNPSMFDISTPQLKVFSNLVEYEII